MTIKYSIFFFKVYPLIIIHSLMTVTNIKILIGNTICVIYILFFIDNNVQVYEYLY